MPIDHAQDPGPTLELIEQLGLVGRLLKLPHGTVERFTLHTPTGAVPFRAPADPDSKYPHMLRLKQSMFLDFLVAEARRHSPFHLVFGARVESLIEEQGAFGAFDTAMQLGRTKCAPS